MNDPRYTKLARQIIDYSCELKRGEKVLLDVVDVPDEFTVELIRATKSNVRRKPFVGRCRSARAEQKPPKRSRRTKDHLLFT